MAFSDDFGQFVPDNLWYLKQFNIFDCFTRSELEEVTKVLRLRRFGKREIIALPTEERRHIYFLVTGKAKVARVGEEGKELILDILRPGEIFGPIAYPVRHYAQTEVIALQDCMAGHICEDDFNKLMREKPELYLAVNKLMGSRLVRLESRLEELLFRDVTCRLARTLLRLADEYRHDTECGRRVDLVLTQQELANLIGASREMTNLTLNQFRRSGFIAIHHRHICLHDLEALQRLAD